MKSFIKPTQKVSDILEQHPQTYQIFRKHGCPDMRSGFFSVMARFMSLRNAARIHRIAEDKLLNDLNESICPQQDRSEKKKEKPQFEIRNGAFKNLPFRGDNRLHRF